MKRPTFGADGTLDRDDTAKKLHCTTRHVDEMIRRGKIWAKKDGRRVIIDRASVDLYLANLPTVAEGRAA